MDHRKRPLLFEFVKVLNERHHCAIEVLDFWIRRFDDVILIRRMSAAAVPETEMAGRQLERFTGEYIPRIRTGVARRERRFRTSCRPCVHTRIAIPKKWLQTDVTQISGSINSIALIEMSKLRAFFASPFQPDLLWVRDAVAAACREMEIELRVVDEVVVPVRVLLTQSVSR